MSPALLFLIADGYLDFGGREKDIIRIFPWFLWSLLFAAASLFFWRRGVPIGRSVARSALVGLLGVVLTAVALGIAGQLGVAGRF